MKALSTLQHFIGCDVSKDTLDFAIHEPGKDYRTFEHLQVQNSPDGFREMCKWLRTHRICVRDAVIAMEHTGSYSAMLAEWSRKKGVTFVFLHPLDVKNYGSRGRNKTDKADAQVIADYVYTMREKLEPSAPEPTVIKRLRNLRNERELTVRTRTSFINMSKSASDGIPSRRILKMIATLDAQVKLIEEEIKKIIASDEAIHRNYRLLLSIPGIGMINALMTIIATGNFTRFQTARQYAKFCCVSPLSRVSGSSINMGNHVSRSGHSELKAVLTEAARSAVQHDPQIKAYYNRKRASGKSHGCVLNAVKFKLICRMFAVILRQQPYVNTDRFRA